MVNGCSISTVQGAGKRKIGSRIFSHPPLARSPYLGRQCGGKWSRRRLLFQFRQLGKNSIQTQREKPGIGRILRFLRRKARGRSGSSLTQYDTALRFFLRVGVSPSIWGALLPSKLTLPPGSSRERAI